MPLRTGEKATNDYKLSKSFAESSNIGETQIIEVESQSRTRKYIYEIGLKMKPKREFSTKKIDNNLLRITRII